VEARLSERKKPVTDSEPKKPLSESERRVKGRRHVNSPAWADPGGVLPVIDCKILDLSETGARVAMPSGVELPDVFQLQIDSSRILGAAEVVWRESHQVGVRFRRQS
jgi:hypothetical protein